MKPGISVLLTKPKDIDYEIFIFKKYRELVKYMLDKKEKKTGELEQDLDTLRDRADLNFCERMSTVYRAEKKKILHSNIDLCDYILNILVTLKHH